ncbi:tetratricopeptide repeat protein [Saprospira sp. CCB-QB6]|uniref:type IX secretion system periplasmic lipoprotein PorW/SprE n=1 Tax=Saprospira sp. CCB-QB6 TaxID=3023936 RepID=UPI0023490010|nr:tetratricopeptide repeat protein [Saprospira sp. CCB-QB6]WCL82209.1 tetratricopeptide repeat protein [Saprospira sp. CCB-QB6]
MRSLKFIWLSISLLFLFAACKTKDGATTGLGKAYHNVTGRYNGYYNAGLLVDESFKSLNQAHRDNYNQLLALYPYAAAESGQAVAPALDNAIKKCAVNIELHRPSHWVDDSYFLIGQSEFLKQEYEKSAETFKYIVDKYNPDKAISAMTPDERKAFQKKERAQKKKKKKRKKKRRKKRRKKRSKKKKSTKKTEEKKVEEEDISELDPPSYFLKHPPVRYEAMLWLAKSYVELGRHDEAGTYLRLLLEDGRVRRKIKAEAYAVLAHSWLIRKEYEKAIPELEQAIELTRGKRKKNRYVYVLAQLYEQQGQNKLAMDTYKRVLRLRPKYEMEFNARLKRATNAASVEDRKFNPEYALKRMLREGKNAEYKDQIYFALAQVQFRAGSEENGILALQQAMANSPEGSFQRAEAAYMLAELYYKRKDYIPAYNYYDTTSRSMQKEDERLAGVQARTQQLKDLAANMQIYELKDSLIMVSNWPYEKQREWVQQERKEELEAANASNDRKPAAAAAVINTNKLVKSNFALYNASQLKRGERDFKKRWGDRPWADNWRRSNGDGFDTEGPDLASTELPPVTEQDVSDFLKKSGVPADEASKKATEKELRDALFMVATLYYERLGENERSLQKFKELQERFPGHPRELEALFSMYNIAQTTGQNALAAECKRRILDQYADSDIAKSLQDPNFLNAKEKELKAINADYERIYAMIQAGKSEEAYGDLEKVAKKYGANNPLKARFALLGAICQGGMQGKKAYVQALRAVVTSFPNTDEEKKAKEMIAILTGEEVKGGSGKTPIAAGETDEELNNIFENDLGQGHYILVSFPDPSAKVNSFKGAISNYNKKYYSLLRLNVSSLMLDGKFPTLIVRKFKTGKEAQEYYKLVEGNKEFLGEDAPSHQVYFIGQNNYRTILQKRNFEDYKRFFAQTYQNN